VTQERVPVGNGDFVRTRELYDMERRLGDRMDTAIRAGLSQCVERKPDILRHDAIGKRFDTVEECLEDVRKTHRSLIFKTGVSVGSVAVAVNVIVLLAKIG